MKELLAQAQENAGVPFVGLLLKRARIKGGMGSTVNDILGWDIILKAKDGECFEYYVAQPPLIGLTQLQPVTCPLGLVAFNGYKIDIEEAIELFHTQNGGDKFTEVTLSWPLIYPAATEPYWHFRTNLGVDVVIGANSGQVDGVPHTVVLYMAKPE